MRYLKVILIVAGFVWSSLVIAQDLTPTSPPTPVPRPAPFTVLTDQRVSLELYFAGLPQGSAGVVRVIDPAATSVESARLRFLSTITDFHQTSDGWYAIVPIGLDVTPRSYPLTVSILYTDGTRSTLESDVVITIGGFLRQSFTIPGERAYLTAPEVERTEYARIESLLAIATSESLWDVSGFSLPLDSEITSPFGAFRTLNEFTQTRHTGWDFRAPVGTPVRASARGIVVYAGPLDIRGNYVMLDHGLGVFSGYAHFSQMHVTAGQTVDAGQIIGVSGNTGRSNGPHLHWEIAVNGEWVDSVAFTEMWLPSPQ